MSRRQSNTAVKTQLAMREAQASYAAELPSRFRRFRLGIAPMGSAADYHFANEQRFTYMREYARAMDRDDAIIGTALDRATDNQVQQGFRLDPQTGDKGLDAELIARFRDWSEDPQQCDLAGDRDFGQLTWLVKRSELLDGDIFVLPTEDGALQAIESDRCRTPGRTQRNVVLGVELDELRRRRTYFFTKQTDLDPYRQITRVGDFNQVSAYDADGNPNVFHVASPTRVTQTRGVTAFRAVFDIAGMWEDTNFAMLVKEQISAAFGIFFEQTMQGYGINPQTGERTAEQGAADMTFLNEGISPGQKMLLPPGVKPSPYHPNVTSQESRQHMRDLLQLIGIQLGLPLQVLLIDPSETNFSGWRGAMDQMKLIFRRQQRHLIAEFHKPVYEWLVRCWLADPTAAGGLGDTARKLSQSKAVFRHLWHPPEWPYVDPLKDATADALRLSTGQASLRQVHAENGRDFQQIARDNVQDIEFWIGEAIQGVQRLRKTFGDDAKDVHWQHLYFRDLPKGDTVTAMLQDDAGGTNQPADKSGKTGKK